MSTAMFSNTGILMETRPPAPTTGHTSTPQKNLKVDSTGSIRPQNTADALNKEKETKKARDVATKFESLLVHSLLKSMRKTTLAENTSNERAMYDDMLDESLADTIVSSGGLGIADRIFEQITRGNVHTVTSSSTTADTPLLADKVQPEHQRLRDLAMHLPMDNPGRNNEHNTEASSLPVKPNDSTTTDIGRLQLVSNLWSTNSSHNKRVELSKNEFIETLLPEARIGARKIGTSPAAVMAVAALETGWGRSMIKDGQGNNSHNLFGIKASASEKQYAITRTTEYINGSPQKIDDRFKVFKDDADAVKGFIDFLTVNPRYKKALEHAGEPERFLRELQKAGYATDPEYADKAISIMRQIEQKPPPL